MLYTFVEEVGNEVKEAKEALFQRTEEKARVAKDVMMKSSSAYWQCDPIAHEEGKTYAAFKELLQVRLNTKKIICAVLLLIWFNLVWCARDT